MGAVKHINLFIPTSSTMNMCTSLKYLILSCLAISCRAAILPISGEAWAGYIEGSSFAIESYKDVSRYGVPVPPGGVDSVGIYLKDLTFFTQTLQITRSSSGDAIFKYVYYCGDSESELEVRMAYPWQTEYAKVCGPGSNGVIGEWSTGYFTRRCSAYECASIDIWLYGVSVAQGSIVGLEFISLATDGDIHTTAAPTTTTTTTTTTEVPSTTPVETTSYETTYKTTPSPTEVTTQEPTEVTTQEPTEFTTQEPTEVTTQEPTEFTTNKPFVTTTFAPTEVTTDDSTDEITDSSTDASSYTDEITDYYTDDSSTDVTSYTDYYTDDVTGNYTTGNYTDDYDYYDDEDDESNDGFFMKIWRSISNFFTAIDQYF